MSSDQSEVTLPPPVSGSRLPLVVTGIALLVVAGFGWKTSSDLQAMESQLSMRSPLIIIDPARIAIQAGNIQTDEDAAKLNEKIMLATRKFHQAGYVVINAESVIAAPEGQYLTASDLGYGGQKN